MKTVIWGMAIFFIILISNYANAGVAGDINGDGKVDSIEAIYALKVASGVYSNLNTSCVLLGKGSWETGVSYIACDVVENNGKTYVCLKNHSAISSSEPPNDNYWNDLSLGGNSIWTLSDSNIHYSKGNVGIGTDEPTENLEVIGTIKADSFIGDGIGLTGRLTIDEAGIGTTDPEFTLHVVGEDERVAHFYRNGDDTQLSLESKGDGETYIQYANSDTGDDAWMAGMDDDETFRFAFGGKGEIEDAKTLAQIDQTGNLELWGALRLPEKDYNISQVLITNNATLPGAPEGDGFRMIYDNHFFGTDHDALVIEKTDDNQSDPDGGDSGIAFVNTGSDGIKEVSMVIMGDNRVGIGTKDPDATLEVNGDVRIGSLKDEDNDEEGYGNALFFSGGGDWTSFDSDNSDDLWIARYNTSNDMTELRIGIGDNNGTYSDQVDRLVIGVHSDGTPGSGTWYPRVTIVSDGTMGIGTTTPDSMLHVESDDERIAYFYRDGGTDAQLSLESTEGGETYVQYANANTGDNAWMAGMDDDEFFKISYGEKDEITDDNALLELDQDGNMEIKGNVGLGISDPDRRLHIGVHKTSDPQIRLTNDDGSWELQGGNNFHILQGTGGSETKLFIDNNGDVGIGTTAPEEKLHVTGDIFAEGNIRTDHAFIANGTTLVVPDYVFDTDFNLISLDQLSEYIKENQHLPDIPSARQIKQNGLNISTTLMQLLKKVEELTLYTIAQQHNISELEHKLKKMAGEL